MLILIGKIDEKFILDGDIKITASGIQGNHDKVGIDAPKEVEVYPEEACENLPDYWAPPYG